MKEHFCGRTISLHVHRHSPGTELRPQPRRHALQPPQGIFRAKSQCRGVSLDRRGPAMSRAAGVRLCGFITSAGRQMMAFISFLTSLLTLLLPVRAIH